MSACHDGTWRSLVARSVRDAEVAGSNPAVPTAIASKRSTVPEKPPPPRRDLNPSGHEVDAVSAAVFSDGMRSVLEPLKTSRRSNPAVPTTIASKRSTVPEKPPPPRRDLNPSGHEVDAVSAAVFSDGMRSVLEPLKTSRRSNPAVPTAIASKRTTVPEKPPPPRRDLNPSGHEVDAVSAAVFSDGMRSVLEPLKTSRRSNPAVPTSEFFV